MNDKLAASQVIVPMVSPLDANLSIDEGAVERICEKFADAGVSVFVLGTTGEGDSLSGVERDSLLTSVVKNLNGRSGIFAGLTGNSFNDMIHDSKKFSELGADCLVAKLPSYYPMNDAQMLLFLEKLADSVPLPLFIYNIPSTTHHSIPLDVIDKLSYHPNIYGLKDSERNQERLDLSMNLWRNREDFDFLVGWAAMSVYGLQNGASGIVPGTANFTPELYVQMMEAVRQGDEIAAADLQSKTDRISALYQKGRSLSQMIPALKVLMKTKGLCSGEVMYPMITMSIEEEEVFLSEVKYELNILNII